MQPYANALLDGIATTTRGMHGGTSPRLLPPNQLALMVNGTNRGGYPRTRPAIRKIPLNYATGVQTNATQAIFQCAAVYDAFDEAQSCLVASIGGRLFRYRVSSSNTVDEISIPTDLNDPTLYQAWMFQGEDFLYRKYRPRNYWPGLKPLRCP